MLLLCCVEIVAPPFFPSSPLPLSLSIRIAVHAHGYNIVISLQNTTKIKTQETTGNTSEQQQRRRRRQRRRRAAATGVRRRRRQQQQQRRESPLRRRFRKRGRPPLLLLSTRPPPAAALRSGSSNGASACVVVVVDDWLEKAKAEREDIFFPSTMLPFFFTHPLLLSLFLSPSLHQPTTNSLLDEEQQEHLTPDAVRALCSPLSGEELLHAADERALAGKCGWAACASGAAVDARRIASRGARRRLPQLAGMQGRDERFCGVAGECELACLRLASRLGTEADALARFERKEEKEGASAGAGAGGGVAASPAAGAVAAAASAAPPPIQLKKREFAAGTAESPIMRSVVVERKARAGAAAAAAAPAARSPAAAAAALRASSSASASPSALSSDPIAVDGYVPRGAAGVVRASTWDDAGVMGP